MIEEPSAQPEGLPPTCSRQGCRQAAAWVLVWNNPKVHTPARRKTWSACDEHLDYLRHFLDRRGFLRDVVSIDAWDG